ncbi:MAG: multidrug transporter, partial [Sphingopyxis terrae]
MEAMPRSFFLYTAVFGLLAGCASVPDLGQKPVPVAAAALDSQTTLADQAGAWPVEGWWRGFGDPQLDALIDEGLAGSPDIAVAAARVRAAEALAQ